MVPAELPEMHHNYGDKWADGFIGCGPITIDGQPPGAPCLYCRLQFHGGKGELGYEFNSAPGTNQGSLTIVDASNYVFSRSSQALPLEAGIWRWRFQTFTTADHTDLPETWFHGKIVVGKV